MKRKETLEKLKAVVEKEGVIRFRYKDNIEGKDCFCAVGHVFNIVNFDFNKLNKHTNGSSLHTLANSYFLDIPETLESSTGLTFKELARLQDKNDSYSDEEERKAVILNYIDELLQKEDGLTL